MPCVGEPFWAKKKRIRWDQLKFNLSFLKETLSSNGELHCEYCGKQSLVIYDWCEKVDLSNVATVDHFYPKSKYQSLKKDKDNLVVSCYSCNNKKKDMLWEVEKIEYPIDKDKISNIKKIV
jgi:5-methylcytosine-specific restriction endonuclease McrA